MAINFVWWGVAKNLGMIKLSNFTEGKDNNFNLIRFVAAFGVLISHSFVLATGSRYAEPLAKSLDMTFGSIAVDVFFITSGFLVTGSLLTRKSTLEFIWARVLRIYPALLVMVILTVFALGLVFTTLPLSSYLTSRETYIYLLKNMSLFTGITFTLPGVFEANPYSNSINSSLWTLPSEIKMYLVLASIWFVLRAVPGVRLGVFKFTIVFLAFSAAFSHVIVHFYFPSRGDFINFFFMFFTGAAYYVLKTFIPLSRSIFVFSVGLLVLSTMERHVFFLFYSLTLAYILFFIAYVPSGYIRAFNRVGDYSYGIYIYAFPVQQSIAALVPGVTVGSMLAASSIVTLGLATLSWHLLEKHSLRFKNYFVNFSLSAINLRGLSNPTNPKLDDHG
ncbi:MAG: acyltransferase family protein [Nitrospiria bacterium]